MNAPMVTAPNSALPVTAAWKRKARDALKAKDMSPESWRDLVAGLVEFFAEEATEPEHQGDCAQDAALALDDADSVRSIDVDGRMRVRLANISKSNVCPYRGKEIPGFEDLGLEPNKVYQLWRHPDELEKAAETSNGVQLLRKHVPVDAEDHRPYDVVGALGTDAQYVHPYLKNSLTIWSGDDIDAITSGKKRELSMGYHYRPEMTPGKIDGTDYDGVMRDIVINHVALVEDGRVGPDVIIGDSKESLMPTRLAHFALLATAAAVKPMLAADAKIDLGPVFRDVTTKNFDPARLAAGVASAVKGKLAKDASMEHVAELLKHIPVGESQDKSVSEEQHNAMEAAAHGESTLGIPKSVGEEFVKKDAGDGGYDAIYKKAMDWMSMNGMDAEKISEFEEHMKRPAEDEEEEEPEEVNEGKEEVEQHFAGDRKGAKDKKAKDKKGAMDGYISKQAHDAALKAIERSVTAKVTTDVTKNQQEIYQARETVRGWVGDLGGLAFDSAAAVYKHALVALKVPEIDEIHPSDYRRILGYQPKAGARETQVHKPARHAFDSASVKTAEDLAPWLKNISLGA